MSPRISGLYNSENDGGPAAFSYWHRRPDHQPETGSLAEDPKVGTNLPISVDRVVRRNLYSHKRTHKYSTHAGPVAGVLQRSKSKCHCTGGKSVPGKAAETQKIKPAQNGPLWREIKLLCVVYATRQGTGISCAPQIVPFPCTFPPSPPNADLLSSASVR